MKQMALVLLLSAVVATGFSASALCQEQAAKGKLCGNVCARSGAKCGPECNVLSRSLCSVPPFFSEEVITTTKGVTKTITILTFIRLESIQPYSMTK